jgi:integrase
MPAATRKIALTDRSMQALRPAPDGSRATVWDARMPGMAVRVSGKGKRSFYVVKRRAGQAQPTWVLLGAYPKMTLAEARAEAPEALGALMDGQDPATLTEAKRRAERQRQANTFGAVAEDFATRLEGGRIAKVRGKGALRDPGVMAAIVRRELIPGLGALPIAEVTRRDIIGLVEDIKDRGGERPAPGTHRKSGGPYAARHALATARRLFDWALDRDLIERSPCDSIKAARVHGAPDKRDRVLEDDEIRRVWSAATATPYPYGELVRVLLLTGQRRDEIAAAQWSEIDLDRALLTLSAERMKAKAGHTVPLTPAVVRILRRLPRFTAGDYVFAGQTGVKPFSGFSKAKKRLDKPYTDADGAVVCAIAPYTIHDLRRTVRTRLSELGVASAIAELCIGHVKTGIESVYDLHKYDKEKRAALLRWERRLLAIIKSEPPADNVVPMARARA